MIHKQKGPLQCANTAESQKTRLVVDPPKHSQDSQPPDNSKTFGLETYRRNVRRAYQTIKRAASRVILRLRYVLTRASSYAGRLVL